MEAPEPNHPDDDPDEIENEEYEITHTMPLLPTRHQAIPRRDSDAQRGTATQRGYGVDWRKLRELKLLRDPLCQIGTHCTSPTVANEVDHIVPIALRPDLRLEWSNLQSSCARCHSAKTAKEDGGFGRMRQQKP